MSKQSGKDSQVLSYGGVPRARLLPPEVAQRKKERRRRAGLIVAVSLVLLVVIAGTVGSFVLAAQAEQRLAAERAATQDLLNQQLEFGEVIGIQSRLRDVDAQRALLESVEVRWQTVVSEYLAVVAPAGVIEGLTVTGNDPFAEPLVLTGPLRTPRSATVVIVMLTPEVPDAPGWLRAFEQIATFGDASLDTVIVDPGVGYLTTVTINLTSAALVIQPTEEATE